MLDPFQRRHLIDALRPPPDHVLDQAIGTTYSLDLLALLTAPLAFTFFDYEADAADTTPTADPLALLEALRRYASRIAVFCDAGRISVPRTSHLLFSSLEGSIFEVTAPAGGVFHPKVWVLHFVGPNQSVTYRLLCLSRNLTFDRSWDTALVLEGPLQSADRQHTVNQPLADFVAALPGMIVGRAAPEALLATVAQMAQDLPRVAFDLPPDIDTLAFYPLGLSATSRSPFTQPVDRSLVISPFLTTKMLQTLATRGQNNILVARLEELQVQPTEVLRQFAAIYTLSDAADIEQSSDEEADASAPPLSGLHAKLYVSDAGDDTFIWTGSANATDAAFTRNVEMLVRLRGARARCGIDAVLGADRETGLLALLERFDPDQAGVPYDDAQDRLDALVEEWQRRIARLGLVAQVHPTHHADQFDVQVKRSEALSHSVPAMLSVLCWPITRGMGSAAPMHLDQDVVATFPAVSYEGLTSFYAVELTADAGDKHSSTRFVLNLPLENAPADRQQRLLRALLRSRADVLRFLLLLLSDSGTELEGMIRATRAWSEPNGAGEQAFSGLPLFEAMVRALDRDPSRVDHIARLIDDLRSSPDTRQLLPDAFDVIWEPIRAVAKDLDT